MADAAAPEQQQQQQDGPVVLPLPDLPASQQGKSTASNKDFTATVRGPAAARRATARATAAAPPPPRSAAADACLHAPHPWPQVSNASGYLCHIHVDCNFDVPPEIIFDIFCHPDNAGAFRDIKHVGYRKVAATRMCAAAATRPCACAAAATRACTAAATCSVAHLTLTVSAASPADTRTLSPCLSPIAAARSRRPPLA